MARRCELTGKGGQSGNRVSHAKNRRRHRSLPNLQKKRIWSPEQMRFLTFRVATSTLRTLDKIGVDNWLRLQQKSHNR